MIIHRKTTSFLPELSTTFKLIKLDWDPHAESHWYLKHNNLPIFPAMGHGQANEMDELLIGKLINAYIYIDVEKCCKALINEKSFEISGSWPTITGKITDEISPLIDEDDDEDKYYKLDSVFPVEICEIPEGCGIGDWITVWGQAWINLPDR